MPSLPGGVVEIIMKWVVVLNFVAYANGATGARAAFIDGAPAGVGPGGGVDLKIAFKVCGHCSLAMPHGFGQGSKKNKITN